VSGAPDGSVEAVHDGAVLRITLNRPDRRNALSHAMIDRLVATLGRAAYDDSLRAVVLTGTGGHFCTGADWVATNDAGQRPRTGDLVRRIPHTAHRLIELLTTIQLPVVAVIRGWAVGLGCNLALAADFAVAAEDATLWEPFTDRGFTPDSGSTWLLPRLVGVARARRMLLLSEKVTGAEAAQWGLIHAAAPDADLDDVAETLLQRLASGPTVALGLTKQAMAKAAHSTLPDAMDHELAALELACRATDFKEGLSAFRDRRPPDFRGR
jgi:2-(1,2-epoxy-1,2-dihydrophenyl)acetyl-CoA isomerase